MKSRIIIIYIFVCTYWCLLIGRAAFLQLFPNEKIASLKSKQFERTIALNPQRGDIYDRNGEELAISTLMYSLFVDPHDLKISPLLLGNKLGRVLKMNPQNIKLKVKDKTKRFVWIKRHLDESVYKKILAMDIHGVGFQPEYKRFYPNGELAAQTIGYTSKHDQGIEGLEYMYEEVLAGQKKNFTVQRDARGRPLIQNGFIFTERPAGEDLVLTLDKNIQFFVENELKTSVEKFKAEGGWGIVLNAKTSEILSLVSYPTFNPNSPGDSKSQDRRNKSITDFFEPGSTMKTFLVAGALTNQIIEPNTIVDVEGGKLKIGKRYIHEADEKHKFKKLSIMDILAKSSNIGTSKIAFEMGENLVYQTYRNFGFGEKTGVDFPGETPGLFNPPPWSKHLTANISFGHGIAATPLQVANAYASIANDGKLMKPYIVKSRKSLETGEIIKTEPELIREVLTPEQSKQMRILLTMVTASEGTGYNARLEGYLAAGKTGTAQKVSPDSRGYLDKQYISSFVGFLPANNPQYVIYVAVDNPQGSEFYGSQVAAPIFKNIAEYLVQKQGLVPVSTSEEKLYKPVEITNKKDSVLNVVDARLEPLSKVPELKGFTLREVLKTLHGKDVEPEILGVSSGVVAEVIPAEGSDIEPGSKIKIRLRK